MSIQTTGGSARFAERLAQDGTKATLAAIGEFGDIVDSAEAEWAVDTGLSRDSFSFELDDEDVVISGTIGNDSGYARFVRRGEPWRRLVAEPFRQQVERLADRIVFFLGMI